MKNDLNDLKGLIFELIRNNNLRIPSQELRKLTAPADNMNTGNESSKFNVSNRFEESSFPIDSTESYDGPIILSDEEQRNYDDSVVVEESLSLETMEKELISKALIKHNGRRKEAAKDLGISERTLYRKIKQYGIQV